MKHDILAQALDEIRDAFLEEAARPKRKHRLPWVGAVAAVLALCLTVGLIWGGRQSPAPPGAESSTDPSEQEGLRIPSAGEPFLLAAPKYPAMVKFNGQNWSQWRESQKGQYDQPRGYATTAKAFFRNSIPGVLTDSTQNQTYSPVNAYMALAMLAETADGSSRQQLLDLLGADSIGTLRTQAGHMWNAHYRDDGLGTSVLANSLWLDDGLSYREDTVTTLADSYYASVYRGDLGSSQMTEALRSWLNEQTKGLLEEQAQQLDFSERASLVLASTIYYNVEWMDAFAKEKNTEDTFHTPNGDRSVTYMHRVLHYGPYYQGEDFTAIALELKDDGRMWLILPQEDCTPADLLQSGHALELVLGQEEASQAEDIRVNLSVPKFDVVSDTDLIPVLKTLGVTDIFEPDKADFSDLTDTPDEYPYISQVQHAARVAIDEEGVLAAAFTVMERDAAAAEIPQEIDFVLNRPFFFCIESKDGIPLFTGIVNEP